MAGGGKRPGAGRPKGAIQRVTTEARAKAAAAGIMPLEYMLSVLRDPEASVTRRDEMAKAAAPYVHPKLSSVEVGGASPAGHAQGVIRVVTGIGRGPTD